MVIKATSSSLGKISDGQSVMCLLPSKSWQNCNNICKQYFFHFLCAALVRDEKRCIPTMWVLFSQNNDLISLENYSLE